MDSKRWVVRVDLDKAAGIIKLRALKALTQEILIKIPFKHMEIKRLSEVGVVFTNDRKIRALNLKFRGKDKATDVLSFSMQEGSIPSGELLGDVVISIDTAKRQAKIYNVNLYQEILRLLIHGLLHLAGHDHEGVSLSEARRMRRLEDKLYLECLSRARTLIA